MKLNLKKAVAVVTAALTICAMSVTAFAQGSVQSTGVAKVDSAKDAEGNAVKVTLSAVPAEKAEAVAEVKDAEKLTKLLSDLSKEDESLKALVDAGATVADVMEVTADEGTKFPLEIVFTVAGVKADSKVAILHFNGTAWESVACKAGEGTITATFTSLSPVAVVVEKSVSTTTTPAPTTTPSGSNGSDSPKTGEANGLVSTMAVLAVLALGAGCVFFAKRKNA